MSKYDVYERRNICETSSWHRLTKILRVRVVCARLLSDHCGGLVLVCMDVGRRRLLDVSKRKLKRWVGTMYNYYYIIIAVCNTVIGGIAVGPGGGREETLEGSPRSEWGVDITGTSVYLQHYDVIKHSYVCSIIKCRRRWVIIIIITTSVKQQVALRLYTYTTRLLSVSFPLTLSRFSLRLRL